MWPRALSPGRHSRLGVGPQSGKLRISNSRGADECPSARSTLHKLLQFVILAHPESDGDHNVAACCTWVISSHGGAGDHYRGPNCRERLGSRYPWFCAKAKFAISADRAIGPLPTTMRWRTVTRTCVYENTQGKLEPIRDRAVLLLPVRMSPSVRHGQRNPIPSLPQLRFSHLEADSFTVCR